MKKTVTRSLALASVIVLSGCSLISQDASTEDVMTEKEGIVVREDYAMMKNEAITQKEALEKNDSMMKRDDTVIPENAMVKIDTAQTTGIYTTYSASAVESALASGKKVVLFFHAPWCPSCKSADSKLSQETLSPDTIVFKTDYDSNVELKRKY